MASESDLNEILTGLKEYKSAPDNEIVKKAFNYAKEKLSQTKVTHRNLFADSVETAKIINKMNLGEPSIVTALLHHMIRDGNVTEQELANLFGPEIAIMVKEFTKFKHFDVPQTEEIKKIILTMTKDIRVVLVLLADRISFMKILKNYPEEAIAQISKETLEIYAPLAQKLGMNPLRNELEDLSFSYLHPKEYKELEEKIQTKKAEREKEINEIIEILKKELRKSKIKARIIGRVKHIYGVWRKMNKKSRTFEEIYDLNAVRIITNTVKECYEIVGLVHSLWKPLPGEFDDYIAKPKENMYQSIHTTVIGPKDKALEIQIRTGEMHKTAEYGVAVHWKYKGAEEDKKHDKKLAWLKQMIEWKTKANDFIDSLKIDFFENEIYVFTPKGQVVELIEGATPLDFAYAVHTDVGNKCRQAKVNGKIVALDYPLQNSDTVEILVSDKDQVKRSWLNIAKTYKARKKIKQKLQIQTVKKSEIDILKGVAVPVSDKRIRLAKCCNPLPGDEAIGFVTTKRKISVHRTDCPAITEFTDKRTVEIRWGASPQSYACEINVLITDEPAVLSDILKVIANYKIRILSTNAKALQSKTSSCNFKLKINDLTQLEKIMKKISSLKGVKNVTRV